MSSLPIVILTKDRTSCAVSVVNAMLDNLSCSGMELRYVVCDDQSVPGHLEAVLKAFHDRGVDPIVSTNDARRHGLGASMNKGADIALSMSGKFLRIEDDWLLKRPLDLGPWVGAMDGLRIGSLRLGMMFRTRAELVPFPEFPQMWRVNSMKRQTFTYNNQVAVVTREMVAMLGKYPENDRPPVVEKHAANRYNMLTDYGHRPPYVAWPSGWDTQVYYGTNLAFAHIGVSISGHKDLYRIPQKYLGYNDPKKDAELRAAALSGK